MNNKWCLHKRAACFCALIFILLFAGCSGKDNDNENIGRNAATGTVERAETTGRTSSDVDRQDIANVGSDVVDHIRNRVKKDPGRQFTIGGVVTNLKGAVVIQNNGKDELTIKQNGKFSFTATVEEGASYSVSILRQPGRPSQHCVVSNGSGKISGADITSIAINCETDTFYIGGKAEGLKDQVVLRNNGQDELKVTGDGAFRFKKQLVDGQSYKVSIQNSPSTQRCKLSPDSGVVSGADVNEILLKCVKVVSRQSVNRHVAMDQHANAVIVWQQLDGKKYHVYMSEYRKGKWIRPKSKDDHISPSRPSVTSASNPQVAMDHNGNALIVWQQSDGKQDQIFLSEYHGGVWDHPDDLSDNISINGQPASNPQVGMNNNGKAVIVWQQSDGNTSQIYKSEYRDGKWAHPTDVTDSVSLSNQDASRPQVAMDNKGNAVIVWQQSDKNVKRLYKNEYHSGSWGQPGGALDYTSPVGSEDLIPDVALDNDGMPKISWQKSSGAEDGFITRASQ